MNYAGALAFGAFLQQGGISNRCLDTNALSVARTIGLDLEGIDTICICYLVTPSMPHQQYLLRRLQRKAPAARIIAIAWSGDVSDKTVILSPVDGLALLKHTLETTDERALSRFFSIEAAPSHKGRLSAFVTLHNHRPLGIYHISGAFLIPARLLQS